MYAEREKVSVYVSLNIAEQSGETELKSRFGAKFPPGPVYSFKTLTVGAWRAGGEIRDPGARD